MYDQVKKVRYMVFTKLYLAHDNMERQQKKGRKT